MPIDSSIYQAVGRGVKSVADYDNEYAQTRQIKLAELMNTAKLDEYKRGVDETNKLNQLIRAHCAHTARLTALKSCLALQQVALAQKFPACKSLLLNPTKRLPT